MDAFKRRALFAALVLGPALAIVGCDQRNSPESVGQKVDRTSEKVASATNDVANKTADVANKTAEVMDDATLTGKVKAAMLAEPGLRSLQIAVSTKDSVVTLTGSVESAALKDRAKQVAGNVAGVRSVVDNLSTQNG